MNSGGLYLHRWGASGPPVLLIHGLGANGLESFGSLEPLASEFRLMAPDRCGHGQSAETGRHAFDEQAEDLAAFVEPGTHVVGTSYGGVFALLVAARCPDRVASLLLNEPVAFSLGKGDPDVDWMVRQFAPLAAAVATGALSVEQVAAMYDAGMLRPARDEPLTEQEERDLRAAMRDPPAWEATFDLAALHRLPARRLVTRGEWPEGDGPVARAFRAVAARTADAIGARLQDVPGGGHHPFDLPAYHDVLRAFWLSA